MSSVSAAMCTLLCICAVVGCGGRAAPAGTALTIDWQRYLGTWYELARFDHKFERNLVGVTAQYRIDHPAENLADSKITVINSGKRDTLDGTVSTVTGKAYITGPNSLKVTFFWPFYGAYKVLGIDPTYRWAVIGSSSESYLWFLHRNDQASDADWQAMRSVATSAGYNLDSLIIVTQTTDAPTNK